MADLHVAGGAGTAASAGASVQWIFFLLALVLLALFFAVGFALLRDWMDSPRAYHVLCIVLAVLSCMPCLLLPLDRARFGSQANSLVVAYEFTHVAIWLLLFVVMPGALTAAAVDAEPTRWRRHRGLTLVCMSTGVGLVVGVALCAASPLFSLRARAATLMKSEHWFSWLSRAHGGRVPRQMLDGPLAVWLLGGALTLAIHAAAGAVALPAMLLPPAVGTTRADQVDELRAALVATREERRALASKYDLRGRPMKRAQRERQYGLEAREQRLVAQSEHLGASNSRLADCFARARRSRTIAAAVLWLLAVWLASSLAASLASQAQLSRCGWRCGFQPSPFAEGNTVDLVGAAHKAAAAAATAADLTLTTGVTGTGTGSRADDAASSSSSEDENTAMGAEASTRAMSAALSAASAAALAAASTPVDTLLLGAARIPPLDAVIVLALLLMVMGWVVSAAAVGGPCGVLRQQREAQRDATAGQRDWSAVSRALCCCDTFCGGCCCNCCCDFCCGICAAGVAPAWNVRFRGSSSAALLRLTIRMLLAALAFHATLLTLAPIWSRHVGGSPEFSLEALLAASPPPSPPPPAPPPPDDEGGWWSQVQPYEPHASAAAHMGPKRQVSLAATVVLVLSVRVPYFGLAWYLAQWLWAAMLLIHLGWAALHGLCRLVTRARAAEGARDAMADEEERRPLRRRKDDDEYEVEVEEM